MPVFMSFVVNIPFFVGVGITLGVDKCIEKHLCQIQPALDFFSR